MMKLILGTVFLIPLCFFNFWLLSGGLLMIMFTLIMNFLCKNSFSEISYWLGMDLLSYILIGLSIWICFLMILASENLYKEKFYFKYFLLVMYILLLSLILTFSSLNMFIFYFFFEVSLIPTLILIVGWGNQPERIQAGIYLLFYTCLFSLPMMIGIFFIYKEFCTLEFFLLESIQGVTIFMYLCINMVFFVKIPMFFLHLWLPKAHVEASISGSMILAGVMLKLGGYGLLRVMKMFEILVNSMNLGLICVSMAGAVYISMVCLRQSDMKMLIAYSSVSHMGLVLGGILTMNLWGAWGAMILMLAHGLSSSGLFCLANLCYERSHSRSLFLNKGFMSLMPSMSLWWFLLCSSNMAAPPSLNLLGEVVLINSISVYSEIFMLNLFILVFYSAVYSLFLFSYSQHGSGYSGIYSFSLPTIREFHLLFLHWVPLNILFLKSEIISLWV
uniref:NADH-ubiquinone oxidoreductase chain 4 n=1 Tax=Trypodendron domesticum TaxID=1220309 RepID=A0A343A6E0_9CUCU|nr:NADH dehydrogenase subunit 4 [Trypodendron domesticum]AOY40119.1 NADH dehydrogenase subunit 4 [Trypodendron domesticum]